MAKKDEDIAAEVLLPEVEVTASMKPYIEKMRRYYYSIPGDVYNRNDVLFRQAIRFMQKHRDTKGEAHVFNKCVNSAKGQAFREFVLPVLLGTAALPVVLEATLLLSANPAIISMLSNTTRYAGTVGKAILKEYKKPTTWIKMYLNWQVQSFYNKGNEERINYVSVLAEGIKNPWISAVTTLVEYRPESQKEKFKVGFINKDPLTTVFDFGAQATIGKIYGGVSGGIEKAMQKEVNYELSERLIKYFALPVLYTGYQMGTQSTTEGIREEIKKHRKDREDGEKSEEEYNR